MRPRTRWDAICWDLETIIVLISRRIQWAGEEESTGLAVNSPPAVEASFISTQGRGICFARVWRAAPAFLLSSAVEIFTTGATEDRRVWLYPVCPCVPCG